MVRFVELGNKLRPVRFGWSGLYHYEVNTGRSALADFAKFQNGVENVSISNLVDLVYAGLVAGCKSQKINVDFELSDVVDWIDDTVIAEVMSAFAESFLEGNAVKGPAKNKPAPAT